MIYFEDITVIKVGIEATSVLKKHKLSKEYDDRVFSVITSKRSLDLQATNSEIRNLWARFLGIIKEQKLQVKNTQTPKDKQMKK